MLFRSPTTTVEPPKTTEFKIDNIITTNSPFFHHSKEVIVQNRNQIPFYIKQDKKSNKTSHYLLFHVDNKVDNLKTFIDNIMITYLLQPPTNQREILEFIRGTEYNPSSLYPNTFNNSFKKYYQDNNIDINVKGKNTVIMPASLLISTLYIKTIDYKGDIALGYNPTNNTWDTDNFYQLWEQAFMLARTTNNSININSLFRSGEINLYL